MNDYNDIFRCRTKSFALKVIRFCDTLPRTIVAGVLSKQLLRSSTSIAANYRAMCLGRSDKEKYAKLCIVVEEADETVFWLELIKESGLSGSSEIGNLIVESYEYTKVFTTYRSRLRKS